MPLCAAFPVSANVVAYGKAGGLPALGPEGGSEEVSVRKGCGVAANGYGNGVHQRLFLHGFQRT